MTSLILVCDPTFNKDAGWTHYDYTQGKYAVLRSALPDSVSIQWTLNDTYQVQLTAWDDGSEAFQMLAIEKTIRVDDQWFIIKQIQPDYSSGVNTIAITGIQVAIDFVNSVRAYTYNNTFDWVDMEGQTIRARTGDMPLQNLDPEGILNIFNLAHAGSTKITVHGNFNKRNVDVMESDFQFNEILSLIRETWPGTVMMFDRYNIDIYSSDEFYKDRGHRIDYLHDTSEVQLSYDSTNLTNAARLIGASYSTTTNVDTGLPTGQINTGTGAGAQDVINDAKKYLGIPYVWGGAGGARGGDPKTGMDCSSFVSQVYKDFGINIPAYTVSMEAYGHVINRSDVQTGDMGFYGRKGSSYHICMALDNQTMIYEPQPGEVCKTASINSYPPTWWERNDQMAAIVAKKGDSDVGADATTQTDSTSYYFTPFWYQNEESEKRWGTHVREDITSDTITTKDAMKAYADSQFNLNPDFTLQVTTENKGKPIEGDIMRVEIRPVDYVAKLKLVGYTYYPYSPGTQTQLTYNSNPGTVLTYNVAQAERVKAISSKTQKVIVEVGNNANSLVTADADMMAKVKNFTNGGTS